MFAKIGQKLPKMIMFAHKMASKGKTDCGHFWPVFSAMGVQTIFGVQFCIIICHPKKWFQKAITRFVGTFSKDLKPILAKVEKSFSHTILNILGFGPKRGLLKAGGMVFAAIVIKILSFPGHLGQLEA